MGKKPILFYYNINKKNLKEELFCNEIIIKESELYIEEEPIKIFSSWKKGEEQKSEKILFLYKDKVKIISKTEKNLFKKNKLKNKRIKK